MGKIKIVGMFDHLPLMSFQRCLQCGRKTLTYYNGLCVDCIKVMKFKENRWAIFAHFWNRYADSKTGSK